MTETQELKPSPCLEIAHVLFMDIVAYSQLPMDKQTSLVGELQRIVRQTADFGRAQKRHQLLRLPTGDGMALVFFGDAEAPVRCALDIGRVLREHDDLKLRMGIHTGPVQRVEDINANRNVAGGGINIAQRVMDCGDAGHILVSSAAAEVLTHISAWRPLLHDLGEVEVKHGVHVHVYNLYNEGAGNPELPKKIEAQRLAASAATSGPKLKRRSVTLVVGSVIVAVALVGGWLFYYSRKAHALGPTDTIVLSDFDNKTGDAVFDDTLKQALSIGLAQSPFINIVSDQKVRDTLQLMGRSPSERVPPDLAREVCQRAGSKAYILGSISLMGNEYVIGLEAVNCATEDPLAREQVAAPAKEKVLETLGHVAAKLRASLGESLATIQRFDAPLEQVTTSSLEALKDYSMGQRTLSERGSAAAIPFFERAIAVDPNFASAEQALGGMYRNLDQPERAAEHLKRAAFQLDQHLSERERLGILASYYMNVTGELEKAINSNELLTQYYPQSGAPYGNLGVLYAGLGQYEKAADATRQALRLNPDRVVNYENLGIPYLALNRFNETLDITTQALTRKLDDDGLHTNLYAVAFLRGDSAEMARQVAWFEKRPDLENQIFALESNTQAYAGRLEKARELTRRAVASSKRAQNLESAALYEADAALREALVSNSGIARQGVVAVRRLAPESKNAEIEAALALALVGDTALAQSLARELANRFPMDTQIRSYWVPVIHAQVSLDRGDPAGAIESLQVVSTFDLADTMFTGNPSCMFPTYVRGKAYLAWHRGTEAAQQFQNLLDHRGIVWNCSTGVLAHVGLAGAYGLEGSTAKARTKYQDFLTLWKDADPDIPILKQAKAEYAKLQ